MNNEKDLELGNYQINESDPTEQPTVKGVDVNGGEYPRLPLDADTEQPKMTIAESIDDFDWPVTGKMKHTELTEQQSDGWIRVDKSSHIRLKAIIDKIAQESGVFDLMLKGSKNYDSYTKVKEKFFNSIGGIEFSNLSPKH